jgi:hypothetical protein
VQIGVHVYATAPVACRPGASNFAVAPQSCPGDKGRRFQRNAILTEASSAAPLTAVCHHVAVVRSWLCCPPSLDSVPAVRAIPQECWLHRKNVNCFTWVALLVPPLRSSATLLEIRESLPAECAVRLHSPVPVFSSVPPHLPQNTPTAVLPERTP